jgi:predicted negative regulator of RcsB-dependent stress response
MTEHSIAFFLLTVLALAIVLIIFGMKYFSAGRIARLRAASDIPYKDFMEKLIAAQSTNASALAAVQADLSEIKTAVNSMAHLLKEVQ